MPISSKRNFLKFSGAALAGATLAAASGGAGAAAVSKLPFVMIHGAWHGAWTFDKVIPLLAAGGTLAVARDLPAHGLDALFPVSYFERPLNPGAFGTEKAPSASTTLDDYVNSVVATVEQVHAMSGKKIILLAHSMGGVVASAVAEKIPAKIAKLVYLTAFMPASGTNGFDYIPSGDNDGQLVGDLLMADPFYTGALRIDQRSDDEQYRARVKAAFYGDLAQDKYEAVANLLTPDVPLVPFRSAVNTTKARWGAIERHYIKCLQDLAIRPKLQERFIAEADAFTPSNLTHVHELESSHSPFMSMPQELAALLATIAAS